VKQKVLTQGVWLGLGLALNAPGQLLSRTAVIHLLTIPGEWCLVVAVAAFIGSPRLARRLLATAWCTLLLLEGLQVGGRLLTSADPQLYDLLFLLPHIAVLAFDLYPTRTWAGILVGICVLPALFYGACRLADITLKSPLTGRGSIVATVLAVGLGCLPGSPGVRWVTPDWVRNIHESLQIWDLAQQSIQRDPYSALRSELPAARPDIQFLIVESYGRVVDTSPDMHDRWHALLDDLEPGLEASDWHMVSGWADAPVSGGRSWISDASTLLGIQIRYESMWAHVQPHIADLTHLPGWLKTGGYQTVVCRPKDRARMGIELRNDFAWDHTVFAEDLDYSGALIGWGEIPDQYSLGWLSEAVLPSIPPPRMVFFHGVSSHGPWKEAPELQSDWRAAGLRSDGSKSPSSAPEPQSDILKMRGRRYGKKSKDMRRARHSKYADYAEKYLDVVEYSLRSMVSSLPLYPDDAERIVIIYGDHQPALLPPEGDFGVPVHILSTNPEWLAPFAAEGFVSGLHPDSNAPAMPLYALYPTLVTALMNGEGPELPRGVRMRTALEQASSP
jgi:hypothetical protein